MAGFGAAFSSTCKIQHCFVTTWKQPKHHSCGEEWGTSLPATVCPGAQEGSL